MVVATTWEPGNNAPLRNAFMILLGEYGMTGSGDTDIIIIENPTQFNII